MPPSFVWTEIRGRPAVSEAPVAGGSCTRVTVARWECRRRKPWDFLGLRGGRCVPEACQVAHTLASSQTKGPFTTVGPSQHERPRLGPQGSTTGPWAVGRRIPRRRSEVPRTPAVGPEGPTQVPFGSRPRTLAGHSSPALPAARILGNPGIRAASGSVFRRIWYISSDARRLRAISKCLASSCRPGGQRLWWVA
jgi:hypothetical protein